MSKVYIKISEEASGMQRVLINWTESCEKDSWEPLDPRTSIRVKFFEKEETGYIGPDADWLTCYLDRERAYEADYISQTDEIRIAALDDEARRRAVKLTCVCFEVTDGADRSGFKKLSISRMAAYEVVNLESMYRNAPKDPRRTKPRAFRVDHCDAIADRGVDITVFDPENVLELGKKYFGSLSLAIVPGEIEPRFKIASVNCSRAEAYPKYFDKSKRVYQSQSSPESSEERLAWYRLTISRSFTISRSYDYAHPSNVFRFFGTFEDDKGRSHRIDGGYFDHIVIMGDSEADPDGVYAYFTSINKGHYNSREYDWYAVERTRMGGRDILVVGVSSKKSIGAPRNKETFDRIMMAMFDAHMKTPAGDHDIFISEPKLEWPKQSFNLADIRYVKRVGDRLFGNKVCGEWVNLDIIPALVASLNGKIERDGDGFVVRPELLEDEVPYTCHYWPEKDRLVLDDFGKQFVEKHGCRAKLVKLSVIDTNGCFVKLRIGRMVKFEQMAILKMYSGADPHSCRETPKTGSEPYGSLRGPLYYAEVCVYDPRKQLSEVDPDKLYDISLVIAPDEIEPRFIINARENGADLCDRAMEEETKMAVPNAKYDIHVLRARAGGKTMYLEAMLAAGIRPWERKNAGCSVPKIERVIFNAPAVIVMWADGSKTVVKAQKGEKFDPEKGLAMAVAKKALGNTSKYYDTFKAWVPEKKKPARKPRAKKTPAEE